MAERKIQYQALDHKTPGFVVTAPSWERLYIDAGLSLTDMMVRLDRLDTQERHSLLIMGNSKEELMAVWLSELLALFKNQKFLARRIVFNEFDGKKIKATLWGETYQPVKHGHVSDVKPVSEKQ